MVNRIRIHAKHNFAQTDCNKIFTFFLKCCLSLRGESAMSRCMTLNKPVPCAVVGVGYLGQHHARIYHELEETELVGILEQDEAKAQKFARKYGCKCFQSIEEVADACEAVSVTVPTDKHAEVSLQLLEKNTHLLIEKPLCSTLREAESILQMAQEHGVIVQVGHIEHFNPVMAYLEEQVNHPRYITTERLAPFNLRGTEVGVVLDLMIHDIGMVLQLVKSPIQRIDSVGVHVVSHSEDIANARILFENGCVANLNTSRVSLKKIRKMRVFQARTYLSMDFMDQQGYLMHLEGDQPDISNIKREKIPIRKGEPLKLELQAFAECVAQHRQPRVSGSLGRQALELAIRITEDIRNQGQRAIDS